MAQDRFLIAPLNFGLQTDVRSWLIPDEAFSRLKNAYSYKGRIRKRFGSRSMARDKASNVAQLTSRLRVQVATTDGAGGASGSIPAELLTVGKIGQLFSIGDEIFTITVTGNPSTMLTTGAATTSTFDTTTGAYVFAGASAATPVYFYSSLPVMGLPTYEKTATNEEELIAFDTRYAYEYAGNAWQRLGTAAWTGGDADFFWAANYRGANADDYLLFVSNYIAADGIKYWDGATWTTINPVVNGANTISTARIILPFKDRLILLNTIESTGTFRNRLRYSQNGDPTIVATSFLETTPGLGGFLDAPTKEAIVAAEFIKDRLIVYFERSTWELVYTGNQILPFRWQKINTELGAEGTFSVVPFDKAVLGVGNVGIHACTGANVDRIDDKIEQEVFAIANEDDGPQRVHGIRDYEVEQVYWTFPSIAQEDQASVPSFPYPDKVLVMNYETGTWGINDDSITTFGYYQDDEAGTWQSTNLSWEEWGSAWNEGTLQSRFRNIVGGNQQGFVFILGVEVHRNAPSLQVTGVNTTTNAITVIDHNLKVGDFIALENMGGLTMGRPTNPSSTDNLIYKVASATSNTITPADISFTGTYTGGGTIARVSEIDIKTKEYNFYLKEGRNLQVSRVDFQVDKISTDEVSDPRPIKSITIDYFSSSSSLSLVEEGTASDSILGTARLETSPYEIIPFEQVQTRLWHSVYMQLEGEFIQLRLRPQYSEMIDFANATSDFQLHAMIFHAQPTSSRLQ